MASRNDPAYAATLKAFPKLSQEQMLKRLALPEGRGRGVLGTHAKNEIDDQPTIAWALLSPDVLEIEGVCAAPFSFAHWREGFQRALQIKQSGRLPQGKDIAVMTKFEGWIEKYEKEGTHAFDLHFSPPSVGMERSYQEILTIFEKVEHKPDGMVFRGSDRFLPSITDPVDSPAARHLIERALEKSDRPLYVVAIGALTNIVSALLLEPQIIENMVVVWTASYPTTSNRLASSLNLEQDLLASQFLFDCGVPHVYLPGYQVGAQLRISQPEMELWVKGRGAIGDYLYGLYMNNPNRAHRNKEDFFGRTWIMWDLINVAWLLNHRWVPSDILPAPILSDDQYFKGGGADRHLMREVYGVNRDAIFRDFLGKLQLQVAPTLRR